MRLPRPPLRMLGFTAAAALAAAGTPLARAATAAGAPPGPAATAAGAPAGPAATAAGAPPARAASLNLRQPLGLPAPPPTPGLPSPAPSARSLAQAIHQATGLQASQVKAVNVCGPPAPGHAACAAQELVLRSTGALVHPHVSRRRTFTQVLPTGAASPQAGTTSSMAAPPTAGTPAYLQQAYDLTYLSQTAGSSDTVAIVDAGDDANAASDLATYRATYGLPPCTASNGCFSKVNQNGGATPLPSSAGPDWETEESLDIDAVSALCPNCHILLVEANSSSLPDLAAGLVAAESLGANQISASWAGQSSSPPALTLPAGAIIAATGDHGYLGAGTDDYPAAFPGVTAAGGTTLSAAANASSLRGFDEAAWSLNSSGTGWGGTSGCDTSESKPAYQLDTGCTGRSYADVSADANPDTGLQIYDSGDGGWFVEGGTSLATPLIAAFEALTGVSGTSAQWAYSDSALLNDPTTGSSGSCAAAISYICNAGIGYDGPTGIGSISGDLVTGAPGIGGPAVGGGSSNTYTQSVGTTTASLAGGVYPNGLDTTVHWEYGTTTSYGQQTDSVDVGSGTAPVAATASLSSLTPGATYHYRLVATNSDGTVYGYDYTFTTSAVSNVAPVNTVAPSIAGSALQGQTLTASDGSWSPTPTSYAYQWQRSTDGGGSWASIAGATGSTYVVAVGDLGDDLRVTVTATNGYGSTAATSASAGPVGSGAPVSSTQPTVSGHAEQGQVLSAVSTWSPTGSSYAYQWQTSSDVGSTWSDVAGATGSTYTLGAADLGDELRVIVTATNAYGSASATSPAVGPVHDDAPVNSGAPTVTGSYQRSYTLTATGGSWTGLGNSLTYQWQRSADGSTWNAITNATSATYTLAVADEGDEVRVLVTATNDYGTTSAPSATTDPIAPDPPANTAPPTVSGVAERGSMLNATGGNWTGPDNVYTYQWQRDGGEGYVNIAGATASDYTLGVADEGATVRVVVAATNADATIVQASAPTAAVTDALPVDQTAPTITGTPQRATTLGADVGTWAGIGNVYAYQWQRSSDGSTWTAIAGATGSTYTVAPADEGDQLRVMITATNPDGTACVPSAATVAIPSSPPVDSAPPTAAGSAQRGSTLTGTRGTWSGPGNSYSYQWQGSADGGSTWTAIAGATTLTYTPVVADEGDLLRLMVTATNPDGSATASSAATAPVASAPPVSNAAPDLTGATVRSDSLTADAGAWGGVGNSYACQWQRSTDGGSTWTAISGATSWTYTVAVADEGARLRALVTATNPDGSASAASTASAVATASPPLNTSAPTMSGPAVRGDTLTSTEGAWTGLGNAYARQWQRSADGGSTWTAIPGATSWSYTLAVADEGDEVRVQITASNPDGSVAVATPATGAVASAPPVSTAAPAVSGPPERGLLLNSALGTWNGIGNAYAYQWQRSVDGSTWTSIAGATQTGYKPSVADEGDYLRLQITASNADGTVAAASAPTALVTATPPVSTVAPSFTGTAQRGGTLIASTGIWQGVGNAYAYQWQRSTDGGTTWTAVPGATSGAYAVGVGDEDSQLRVLVTATNVDGSAAAASAATATIPVAAPVNTVAPTVGGTDQRGFLLTATPGTWSGIGNSLAYQWQRSTDGGTTWLDIDSATGTTYTITVGDEGAELRVLVTASNADGTVSAPSAATATVSGSPPANTSLPTVGGNDVRGSSLSSTAGVWSGSGDVLTFQWQRSADGSSWTSIAGATGQSYTLQAPDEGGFVRLQVTAANVDGTATVASAPTARVTGSPPVNTAAPALAGSPRRTSTLTVTSGSWSGVGNTLAYQWQRSADGGSTWTSIAGATTSAYTLALADEGGIVRALVTATNADGSVAAASAPTAPIAAAPPVSTSAPTVTGTPRLGATLVATDGSWSPNDATYAYQWQHGDATDGYQSIAGATASTYTTVAADVGENVRVVVTATNADGTTAATSAPTQPVSQPPVNLTAPAAPSGTLMNGDVLTPDDGSWDSPATYSYTWLRCPGSATSVDASCAAVGSGSTYTLQVADIGYEIAVTVKATSIGGSTQVNSALTPIVSGQPLTDTIPPSISGDPQPPNTLYANPGSWSVALSTASYQWERCDADGVSNCAVVATDTSHYTLSGADEGHTLVLIADVTSPGRAGTAQSPPLTIEAQPLPQPTVLPTVSGTPTRTHTLAATGGTWSNQPTSLSYQWERCNSSGQACTAVPGATHVTYELTAADEGYEITIAVTAGNASGTTTASAKPTAVVVGLLPVATSRPGLSALALQQSVPVSESGDAWQTTSDTTYATQWERCDSSGGSCAAIAGATQKSYTPVAADVGHTLVVVVTATNVDGSVSSASPASNVVLPAAPRWRDLPVLSGSNGDVGGTLTVTPGVWTGPTVSSDAVQMMRCTSSCVSVASGTSYTIASADVGSILRVRETASNLGGTTVVWSAQYAGPVASAGSASVVMLAGRAILRGDTGTELAVAQVHGAAAMSSDLVVRHRGRPHGHGGGHARRAGGAVRTVVIRRARGLRGALRVWACPAAATGRGQAPLPCTRAVTLRRRRRSLKLRLPQRMTGRVRIVVVRRGH